MTSGSSSDSRSAAFTAPSRRSLDDFGRLAPDVIRHSDSVMQITAIYRAFDSVLPLKDSPNAAFSWIGTRLFTTFSQVFAGRIMFYVRQRSPVPTVDCSRSTRARSTGADHKHSRIRPMSGRLVPPFLLRTAMHRLWANTLSLRPSFNSRQNNPTERSESPNVFWA